MDVRKDFPILKRKINGKALVYLDNAATTQKPQQVIDAISEFYENHNANVGRGVHALAREASEMYADARKKVARFINAKPDEIVFTNNTTQGLNMVADSYGQRMGKYDEIAMTVMEHHSSYLPWRRVSERTKAGIKLVDIDDNGILKMKDYEKKVRTNTTVVAAMHVSNVLGTINPVREMAKIAHQNGAVFVMDAAQSVPHMPVDVKRLDCDFMAFSGHKMVGPTGIGVLYGRYDLLEDMEPPLVGGGMVARAYPGDVEFLGLPEKFDAGTPNAEGAIGLAAAINYLERLGMDKVQKHEQELTKRALDKLKGIKVYGPEERAGVIGFNVPGVDADDVAAIMDENGIAIRSGHHCAQPLMRRLRIDGCARMSFYVYNTKEEVDYVVDVINKIRKLA